MRVPAWLEHLRLDKGRPVPYVNRWGPERPERFSIRPDRHAAGRLAVFDGDADETVPDFTAQNLQRQRECMVAGLCQVCAREVPWSRRFLVLSSVSIGKATIEGIPWEQVVITEPWLDEACARLAVDVCPALIRRGRDADRTQVHITSEQQVVLTMSVGTVAGPLKEESERVLPAMWAKALLLGVDIRTAPNEPTT